MKLFILKLFAALLLLPTILPAQSPDFCGAHPSEAANEYLYRTRRERTNHPIDPSGRSTKVVRVQVHIIQKDDGTQGADYNRIVDALDDANVAFAPANIVLQQCGPPNYIKDDQYVIFNGPGEEDLRAANDAAGAINLYFAKTVKYLYRGNEYNVCGYADFPEHNVAGTYTGFTAVANNCIESSLIHELGHCFGIYHTHETLHGDELVTRSGPNANCASAGDLMCDTPADPNISGRVDNDCNYTGNYTDANGDLYVPNPLNFMAYTHKPCRSYFSPQQLAAINYSAHNDYPNTECVTGCAGGGIDEFPYHESFELPGVLTDQNTLPRVWQQDLYDDANWSRRSTATPSGSTGPISAKEGAFFLYTEASGNYNKDFGLVSPCFNLWGKTWATVEFNYHMYGADMGTLKFQVSTDGGSTWTDLWSISGNQFSNWKTATIDLAAYLGQSVRFRFFATTGNSFRSDIAIDNFTIDAGPNYASLPYFNAFDNGSLDKYWETESNQTTGRIMVTNAFTPIGTHQLTMDQTVPGPLVRNEVRLGVKMSGESNALLVFFYKIFNTAAFNQSLLYLSDDGGATYSFVLPMVPPASNTWIPMVLPISQLATALGLELNDQFVIKWEYTGNLFMPVGGMAIDMVQVLPGSSSADGAPEISLEELTQEMEALAEEANRHLLEEELETPITCYPNPFRETFTLDIPQSKGAIQTIQVLNLNGQILHQQNGLPAGQQLELGRELPAGIYFIRVQTERSQETIKMIKAGV